MHEMDVNLVATNSDPKVEIIVWYRHLCQTFVQISSEVSEFKEGYELAAKCANEVIAKSNDVKKRNESHEEPTLSKMNRVRHILDIDYDNFEKAEVSRSRFPERETKNCMMNWDGGVQQHSLLFNPESVVHGGNRPLLGLDRSSLTQTKLVFRPNIICRNKCFPAGYFL
ncbi:hypothetical protein RND71_040785 [Anisodus tanguticus]|uniref:Uncharacterized protein n=1 Tax=Anisodus tanguticus TaxID=243964 RepID=A0AAE1UP93_9SOLA|nr:hypothetical protein RND71_040785 [Anisodus tanguticus]